MDQHTNAIWPGWEVVRTIGQGSFGAVYEIQRNTFGNIETAALKVISIPQSKSDIDELYNDGYDDASITTRYYNYLQDILKEYAMMVNMKGHTNVVYCDDFRYEQHEDGFGWDIFIKMELLTPLTRYLPREIPENMVIRMGMDICNALVLCKDRNIVHRDIKPQNIFVSRDGNYKLGDFGIAKTAERTTSGTKVGTYKYMAPEVYNNQPYGTAADIYSLGLVLYWMLNERRTPFLPLPPEVPTAGAEDEARRRRFSGESLPAPAHGSEELKAIVLKACAYDPKERYASATEMLEDLKKLDNGIAAIPVAAVTAAAAAEETARTAATEYISRTNREQTAATAYIPREDPGERTVNIFNKRPDPPVDAAEEATVYLKEEETVYIPREAQEKPKKPKKKKKGLLLLIGGILLAILLLLGLRFCSKDAGGTIDPTTTTNPPATTRKPTTQATAPSTTVPPTTVPKIAVPNVVGKEEAAAASELETLGFVVIIHYEKADSVPEGNVISQDVEEGTQLEAGAEIVLTVSSGKPSVAVADVVGKTEKEAKSTLEKQGFKVTIVEKNSDTVAEGKVISQSVKAGTQLVIGSEIRLTVSIGKASVAVADVVGKTKAQAKDILEDQGFKVSFKEQNSDTVAAGKVISQSPKAGAKEYAGTTITVVVSKGPATMTVTFNANGGKVSTSSVTATKTQAYGTLPTPTRDYYDFAGWYTALSGGTLVTANTTVTSSENHTLYARWTLKPLSDWVLASQAPADAQIVYKKWTYTLTSYTTSSSSTLSGWTLYDTTSEWGSYGDWSAWSTTAVTETDSRDVETKKEITSYKMEAYNTKSTSGARQFRSFSIKGKYSDYGCSSSYGEFHYTTTVSAATVNSATTVAGGKYTSACTYPGYNKDSKTGYIITYKNKKYVFFISSNVYTTYYRYRDRSLVYTYYFYKQEAKESTTEVTASNTISNVQKWVRYRPK